MDTVHTFIMPTVEGDGKNLSLLYWLELDCAREQSVVLTLSAIDVYKLYVNEEFVCLGPARAAKGYSREDTAAVTLRRGRNRIAVLACGYGVGTYSATRQKPFFYCDFEVDGRAYTAADFTAYDYGVRVRRVQRYSSQRAFCEAYVQAVDTVELLRTPSAYFRPIPTERMSPLPILARRVPQPISVLLSADVPIAFGDAIADPRMLHPHTRYIDDPYDGFEYYPRAELAECTVDFVAGLTYEKRDAVSDRLLAGQYAVYDLGRNLAGFFGLDLQVDEHAELYYTFDERLQSGDIVDYFRNTTCNVIKWELEPGRYSLESMDLYGSRYVQIILRTGSARIERVTVRTAENPDAYNMEFSCGDGDVLRILRAAQNTLAQCAVDLFMDCPSRERAGWINDVFFTRRAAEVLMGNTRVERATLENYALGEPLASLPRGMLPMCYPAEHITGRFIPNCAMWYGIIACEYCVKTGDGDFAALIKGRLYELIRYFEGFENEHGLLENLESWVFVEWSEANSDAFVSGVNFPSNMMYVAMLEAMATLYGDEKIAKKATRMRDSIQRLSYNGDFFEDNRLRDAAGKLQSAAHVSEACQYHAFYFGYADRATYPTLYGLLETVFVPERDKSAVYPSIDKANIITGLMMREFIWLENGEHARAVDETKRIFLPMAQATDTLWEHTGDYASCNHGCAAYAAYVLVRAYTGFYGLQNGLPVFDDRYLGRDCDMTLSLERGVLHLSVKNGVRTWRVE